MSKSTVAVIGGGPYGLACTAHLRAAGDPLLQRERKGLEQPGPGSDLVETCPKESSLGELLYRRVG